MTTIKISLSPISVHVCWTFFILGHQTTDPADQTDSIDTTNFDGNSILIRDRAEIDKYFNSKISIDLDPLQGYEDTHFLTLLHRSAVHVDKTLLIKRMLEIKEKIILITSPPGTGKSINLSMLKAFFEIRVQKTDLTDPSSQIYPRNQTSTYKFFTTGKLNTTTDSPLQSMSRVFSPTEMIELVVSATYTSPPLISQHPDVIDQHQGKYPVIYMEFYSVFFKVSNITESLRLHVCDVFTRHKSLRDFIWRYIQSTPTRDKKQKARTYLKNFLYYNHRCYYGKPLSLTDLEDSIQMLSKILHQVFNKPVIILMDEYVKTLQYYLFEKDQREKTEDQAADCIQLLRNFMKKSFAQNHHFKKAFITGTLSINKKDLFADIDDYVHYNVIHNDLQEFYGLTRDEVRCLAERFYINMKLRRKTIHFYYGYHMKPNLNLSIYNTWSVVNTYNYKMIGKYWVYHNETFAKLVSWLDMVKLRKIMKLKPILYSDKVSISFSEIDFSMKEMILSSKHIYTENKINQVLSLLCEMGILTINPYARGTACVNPNDIYIRIASDEVRKGLKRLYMHRNYGP